MSNRRTRKLRVSRETIRQLDALQLHLAAGGAIKTADSHCSLNGSAGCKPAFTEVPLICGADYTVPCTVYC